MSPKHEDRAETAAWSAAMRRTDARRGPRLITPCRSCGRPPHVPAGDCVDHRAPAALPPDALTVHGPPPLLTRCDDCPDYGCRACIRTATDTTGRPLWSPDAILTTREPVSEEDLERIREQLRHAPNQGRVYLAPTPP